MRALSLTFFLSIPQLLAEPLVDSWLTERSGAYARAYVDTAAQVAQQPAATWVHPDSGTGQPQPTYAGVHQIVSTADHVYIRASGLGYHTMGPWYRNVARTAIVGTFPENQSLLMRYAKVPEPAVAGAWPATSLGTIGYYVDGVAIFDSRDALSYSNATQSEESGGDGDRIWNRDAYENERLSFDANNAHMADGLYHAHVNPMGLRHELGDNVDYDAESNTYTEAFKGGHSPIIGWVEDGYPLYGPYGYSDPLDPESAVRRMMVGYQKRALNSGDPRSSLPQWCADLLGKNVTLTASETGPNVDTVLGNKTAVLGQYIEDYEYKGDVAENLDFDLDRHNGRWCVTPEFPNGTYAYFLAIDAVGTPQYPYSVGAAYYGVVSSVPVSKVPEDAEIHFQGGPGTQLGSISLGVAEDTVTLLWNSAEGGNYLVEKSEDLLDWESAGSVVSQSEASAMVVGDGSADRSFYRIVSEGLSEFDVNGFQFRAEVDQVVPAEPNILLIILDDWGVDSSPWDNPHASRHAQMANIDQLVRRGLRFTNAYTQSTCAPTRASILTGKSPIQHGIGAPGPALDAGYLTLPRLFAAAGSGYSLGTFGKWHLGNTNSSPETIGGWTEYSVFFGGGTEYTDWDRSTNGQAETNVAEYSTTEFANNAITFIENQGDNPWFCWLAFNAPHSPFHEPPSGLLQSDWDATATEDRDLYEKMLEACDTEIGRVLEAVDLTKTTVILLGDNGTPGSLAQAPYQNGHAKGSLYDGGGHVPMVIAGASVRSRGVTQRMVHCSDLYATIAEIAGIDASAYLPQDEEFATESFLDELTGERDQQKIVVMESFGDDIRNGRALREGDYRLVINDDPRVTSDVPTYEAYYLGENSEEIEDLLAKPLDPELNTVLSRLASESNRLAGGYDIVDFTNHAIVELFIELPNVAGDVARLYNGQGNVVAPVQILVGGVEAVYVNRENALGVEDQYWVKAYLDASLLTAGTHTITVDFGPAPASGNPRVSTAINSYVK